MIIVGTLSSLSQEDLSGSLACKTYNTSKMDCSRRNLVDIPILDKNWTTMLDLSHNQLKEIHGSPFANLSNLISLDLSYNMISRLNSMVFKGLYSLLKLDLSRNNLFVLSSDVFSELHELVNLDISVNPLYDISSETFTKVQSLQYLYMEYAGNQPDTVTSDFRSLTRLTVFNIILYLSVNVTDAIFHPLAGLPIQDFTFVWGPQPTRRFCYLNVTTLEPFTNVKELFIDFLVLPALGSLHSPLQTLALMTYSTRYPDVIGNTTFEVLSNVKESLIQLGLMLLPIRHIENDAFRWTPNLITLLVTYTQLQTIDKEAFRGLTDLRKLYLDENQLTAVPSEALSVIDKFQSLQYLDLGSNGISAISDDAFSAVSSLSYLNLENNKFQDYSTHIRWLDLLQNLQHIVFGSSGPILTNVDIDLLVPLPFIQILELKSIYSVYFKTNICSVSKCGHYYHTQCRQNCFCIFLSTS